MHCWLLTYVSLCKRIESPSMTIRLTLLGTSGNINLTFWIRVTNMQHPLSFTSRPTRLSIHFRRIVQIVGDDVGCELQHLQTEFFTSNWIHSNTLLVGMRYCLVIISLSLYILMTPKVLVCNMKVAYSQFHCYSIHLGGVFHKSVEMTSSELTSKPINLTKVTTTRYTIYSLKLLKTPVCDHYSLMIHVLWLLICMRRNNWPCTLSYKMATRCQ